METVPESISQKVSDIVAEVSDEVGEEGLGQGYLLKYEGWSSICVSEAGEELSEEDCYQYAESQTNKIIHDEWAPELKQRNYQFITGDYSPTGLYGVTWALFKKKETKMTKKWNPYKKEAQRGSPGDSFEIMFYDLTEAKQRELLDFAGLDNAEDANWDTMPIAMVPYPEDEEEVTEEEAGDLYGERGTPATREKPRFEERAKFPAEF